MRKNGINRELLPVDGGVCAPAGFKANAVVCQDGEKLSLIVTDGRYPASFAFSSYATCGAPVSYTRARLQSGYARAILVNSGSANIALTAKPAIEKTCLALSSAAKISEREIAFASTGTIGKEMCADTLLPMIKSLVSGATNSEQNSLIATQALTTESGKGQQLSFAFQLGDFTCKIGAIFKGNQRICPNMATFLCFFTTDTNISSDMLKKALAQASADTFNQLNIDGVASPNDTVGIIASGLAGNSKIDCADAEYEKFAFALKQVATRVCLAVAQGEDSRAFSCAVTGAKSKSAARSIAKRVVGAYAVKRALAQNDLDIDDILCSACCGDEKVDLQKVVIKLLSNDGQVILFESGERIDLAKKAKAPVILGENITIALELGVGNYTATAIGRV